MRAPSLSHTLHNQQGFTLLELLLVVTIISGIAWMSLDVVNNNSDQIRFEETRNRLAKIRRAIIGDTSRTINGSPEISGYVADMGSLPPNLQALVSQEYCVGYPDKDISNCASAGGTWSVGSANEQPDWAYDPTYGLWHGWNGPYLKAKELIGYPKFKDGWGNVGNSSNNFGWNLNVGSSVTLQSYGADGLAGATGGGNYEADYPPSGSDVLVAESQYRIKITDGENIAENDETGGIRVHFGRLASCWRCSDPSHNKRVACEDNNESWFDDPNILDSSTCTALHNGLWESAETLCMSIAVREKGTFSGSPITSDGSKGVQTLTYDGNSKSVIFSFEDSSNPDADRYLALGQYAYRIFVGNDQGNSDPSDDTCDITRSVPKNSDWQVFSVVPGTVMHPLYWELH